MPIGYGMDVAISAMQVTFGCVCVGGGAFPCLWVCAFYVHVRLRGLYVHMMFMFFLSCIVSLFCGFFLSF